MKDISPFFHPARSMGGRKSEISFRPRCGPRSGSVTAEFEALLGNRRISFIYLRSRSQLLVSQRPAFLPTSSQLRQLRKNELMKATATADTSDTQHPCLRTRSKPWPPFVGAASVRLSVRCPSVFWDSSKRSSHDISWGSHPIQPTRPPSARTPLCHIKCPFRIPRLGSPGPRLGQDDA